MIDVALLCIILFYTVLSCIRGFVFEIIHLTTFILSIYLILRYHDIFVGILGFKFVSAGMITSTVLVYLLLKTANMLICTFILSHISVLKSFSIDRFLGAFVGSIKGLAIAFFVVACIEGALFVITPKVDDLPEWLEESRSHRIFNCLYDNIELFLPNSVYEDALYITTQVNEVKLWLDKKLRSDQSRTRAKEKI